MLRPGGQCAKDSAQIGVVSPGLAPLGVDHLPLWGDHKDAALLHRITLNFRLPVSCSVRAQSRREHPQRPRSAHASLQRQRTVGCSLWVCEEADAARVAAREFIEVGHGPVADDDDVTTEAPDLRLRFQDLSNLLATKNSAEVTNKHQDCGLITPAAIEDDRVSVAIKDGDTRERVDAVSTILSVCTHSAPSTSLQFSLR